MTSVTLGRPLGLCVACSSCVRWNKADAACRINEGCVKHLPWFIIIIIAFAIVVSASPSGESFSKCDTKPGARNLEG